MMTMMRNPARWKEDGDGDGEGGTPRRCRGAWVQEGDEGEEGIAIAGERCVGEEERASCVRVVRSSGLCATNGRRRISEYYDALAATRV